MMLRRTLREFGEVLAGDGGGEFENCLRGANFFTSPETASSRISEPNTRVRKLRVLS